MYQPRPTHRYALCTQSRKHRYRNRHDAKLVLERIKRQAAKALSWGMPTRRNEGRAYKCPYCNGWHLTSKLSWE